MTGDIGKIVRRLRNNNTIKNCISTLCFPKNFQKSCSMGVTLHYFFKANQFFKMFQKDRNKVRGFQNIRSKFCNAIMHGAQKSFQPKGVKV